MESGVTWRPLGIRHRLNEILIDVVETMDAIIDQRGMIVSAEISGVVREEEICDSICTAAFAFRFPSFRRSEEEKSFPRWI